MIKKASEKDVNCKGDLMYSLPAGWHGINLSSPSKKPKASVATSSANQRVKQSKLPLNERRKWTHSAGLDPSMIRSSSYPAKKMPVTKTRANGGPELKARTQEEISAEMMALRKEVAHAKDENTLLKGRLRRMEEDQTKKAKQFEKMLAAAKRESLVNEKRKESESVNLLKQKCVRLEQSLKEKEIALKKLQQERTLIKTREMKDLQDASSKEQLSNARFSLDNRRLPSKTVNRASSVPTAEVTRLKDSAKKLQQEVANLQLQLKEKDQEVKNLKYQLVKAQKAPPATRRVQKIPEVRQTTVAIQQNTRTVKSVTTERHLTKIQVSEPEKKPTENGNCSPNDPKVQALQKDIAAKKIQRSWREHRYRVLDHSQVPSNQVNNTINEEQEEEAVVLLQSVMRGHKDRLEYLNEIQQKGEDAHQLQQEE